MLTNCKRYKPSRVVLCLTPFPPLGGNLFVLLSNVDFLHCHTIGAFDAYKVHS